MNSKSETKADQQDNGHVITNNDLFDSPVMDSNKQSATELTREAQFGINENPSGLGDGDHESWLEIMPQIIFIIFTIGLVIYAAIDYDNIIEFFSHFVDWVKEEPLTSSVAIVAIYVLLVIFTFPILYLTIALGFAFAHAFSTKIEGYIYGFILITGAVELGGVVVLFISRYWLSKTIKRRCLANHKSFLAINHIINKEGWKTVLLLRLTPFPYSVVSYFLGITTIKLKEYMLGSSVIGIHIALWLYIGQSFDRLKEIKKKSDANEASHGDFLTLSFEIVMTFLVGFYISYRAKIHLDKKIDKENHDEVVELAILEHREYDMGQAKTPEFIQK